MDCEVMPASLRAADSDKRFVRAIRLTHPTKLPVDLENGNPSRSHLVKSDKRAWISMQMHECYSSRAMVSGQPAVKQAWVEERRFFESDGRPLYGVSYFADLPAARVVIFCNSFSENHCEGRAE